MILNKETIPEGEDADEYAGQFYLERKSWENCKKYIKKVFSAEGAFECIKANNMKLIFECKKNKITETN
jgi:hypothetical protein